MLLKFIDELRKNKTYKIYDIYNTEIPLKNIGNKNLIINFEPYYTIKSQISGEKDIISLAKKNKLIESEWYFLKNNSLWISTAISSPLRYNPQTGECQVSVRGFFPPLNKFPDREITYYHFHTYGMYKNIRKNFISAGETKELAELKALLEITVPSPKDLKSFSNLKNLYPQKTMNFKIGTFAGITRINLKKDLGNLDNNFLAITENLNAQDNTVKTIYEYFELINQKYQDYFELIFLKP